MDKPTGGSAFPRSDSTGVLATGGMTLRDWFAGQALAAMLPKVGVKDWDDKDALIVEHIGSLAYEVANRMIAERDK